MGLIYKIACDITNKCYVGQTIRTLKERIFHHLYDSKNGSEYIIHKAIRKYGWKHFNVEILEDNIPLENLNERELYYTKKFKALAPNGYVLIAGGEPRIFSEETRRKISNSLKGHIPWNKNKKFKKYSSKNHPKSKSILCYDLNDKFLKEYNCMRDASRELNLNPSHITLVCQGKSFKTKGYKFKYKEEQ